MSHEQLPWKILTQRIVDVAQREHDFLNLRRAQGLSKKEFVPMPGQALLEAASLIPPGTILTEEGLSRTVLGLLDIGAAEKDERLKSEVHSRSPRVGAQSDPGAVFADLLGHGSAATEPAPVVLLEVREQEGQGVVRFAGVPGEASGILYVSKELLPFLFLNSGRYVDGYAIESALGGEAWVRQGDSNQFFLHRTNDGDLSTKWDTKNGAIEIWLKPWSKGATSTTVFPQTVTSFFLWPEQIALPFTPLRRPHFLERCGEGVVVIGRLLRLIPKNPS